VQFLAKYPSTDFKTIVAHSIANTYRKHSEYNNQDYYPSGTIVPFEDYILLSFARLDKDGLGKMTREEFLTCLDLLWKEIDKYRFGMSVVIPILGSGITRFQDELICQQQLLDMIIASYRLYPCKIKAPAALHFVCKKNDVFSINKIGDYI